MTISLNEIGSKNNHSEIIEMHITSNNTTLMEDITNNDYTVDEQFIFELEEIVYLLKEHNKEVEDGK
jgi:hypothetical protein